MSMQVIFSHGKESGPWGTKIMALAEVAKDLGCQVDSVDYRTDLDVEQRVSRLKNVLQQQSGQPIYLVGSSMGGYVATVAAGSTDCAGLFLMAPAFYLGGYADIDELPLKCPVDIVHGWQDDIVPVANSWRFALGYRANLHVLNDDHRLVDTLPQTTELFKQSLTRFITNLSG